MSDLWLGIVIGAIGFYIAVKIDLFLVDWYNDYRMERLEKKKAKGVYV